MVTAVALVKVTIKLEDWPTVIAGALAVRLTVGGGAVTVTVAVAVAVAGLEPVAPVAVAV
jgi:hypothetical protein